jgi:hypothetical protein
MQLLSHSKVSYTIPQQFFIEKVLEMLYRFTIDTYRARVMNPKTIMEEICDLLEGRIKGRIPNNKAILYAILEAQNLLNRKDTYLNFFPLSLEKVKSVIGDLHNEKNDDKLKKNLIVLRDFYQNHNKDYSKVLLKSIETKINLYDSSKSLEDNFSLLDSISTLSNYFVTELMYLGFTKRFLYRKFTNEFNSPGAKDFKHSFENIAKVAGFDSEEYNVIFKIEIPAEVVTNLQDIPNISIVQEIDQYIKSKSKSLNEVVMGFATKKLRQTHFYCLKIIARDVFQALNKGRVKFAENLDLINLGYSGQTIETWDRVLIINKQGKDNFYTTQPVAYELDGQYKDGDVLYKNIVEAINRIEASSDIKKDSKEKIKSAVRYLRLGNEALEVEHKFINYWFALEHLFSDALTENNDAVINKIKYSFPKLHSNIFLKRIIKDFHDNAIKLKLDTLIPNCDADLEYLKDESTYDWIITNLSQTCPLFSFRAIKLKKALFGAVIDKHSVLGDRITQHRLDLEWHLSRMYRIRNAIVHDASSGKNIISITANLKY